MLVLLLSFWYMFSYDATGAPLGFTMLAYAVVWKNDQLRRQQPAAVAPRHDRLPEHLAVTAERLGQDDREQDEEFIARTVPLPAIDVAGFEASAPVAYAEPPARAAPDPATAAGTGRAGAGRPGRAGLGVARGGVVNLAGAVISAASSVALTVIVTRNFSKTAVGTFFVAMSLFLIVEAVTNLGAYNGTIYFIARLRALHAERRIPAIIRATVIPVVISSVIGAAALIIFVHSAGPGAARGAGHRAGPPWRPGDRAPRARGGAAVRGSGRHDARRVQGLPRDAAHRGRRPDRPVHAAAGRRHLGRHGEQLGDAGAAVGAAVRTRGRHLGPVAAPHHARAAAGAGRSAFQDRRARAGQEAAPRLRWTHRQARRSRRRAR